MVVYVMEAARHVTDTPEVWKLLSRLPLMHRIPTTQVDPSTILVLGWNDNGKS